MRRTITALSFAIITAAPLAAQQGPAPAWNVLVGAGAIAIPSYPGSDEHRIFPFPLAKVSYRDRAYFGPSSGGNGMALG
ncbi:MAG TPA: MipA/OmpV family protein, partial [Gemmatimonadales bacterium]